MTGSTDKDAFVSVDLFTQGAPVWHYTVEPGGGVAYEIMPEGEFIFASTKWDVDTALQIPLGNNREFMFAPARDGDGYDPNTFLHELWPGYLQGFVGSGHFYYIAADDRRAARGKRSADPAEDPASAFLKLIDDAIRTRAACTAFVCGRCMCGEECPNKEVTDDVDGYINSGGSLAMAVKCKKCKAHFHRLCFLSHECDEYHTSWYTDYAQAYDWCSVDDIFDKLTERSTQSASKIAARAALLDASEDLIIHELCPEDGLAVGTKASPIRYLPRDLPVRHQQLYFAAVMSVSRRDMVYIAVDGVSAMMMVDMASRSAVESTDTFAIYAYHGDLFPMMYALDRGYSLGAFFVNLRIPCTKCHTLKQGNRVNTLCKACGYALCNRCKLLGAGRCVNCEMVLPKNSTFEDLFTYNRSPRHFRTLVATVDSLQADLREAQANLKTAETRYARSVVNVAQGTADTERYKAMGDQLRSERNQLRTKLQGATQKATNQSRELRHLTDRNVQLADRNRELEAAKNETAAALSAAEGELRAALQRDRGPAVQIVLRVDCRGDAVDAMARELRVARSDQRFFRDRYASIREQSSAMVAKAFDHMASLRPALNARIAEANEKARELDRQLVIAREQLEGQMKTSEDLDRQLGVAMKKVKEREAVAEHWVHINENLALERDELAIQRDELAIQRDELAIERDELTDRVHELEIAYGTANGHVVELGGECQQWARRFNDAAMRHEAIFSTKVEDCSDRSRQSSSERDGELEELALRLARLEAMAGCHPAPWFGAPMGCGAPLPVYVNRGDVVDGIPAAPRWG